MDRIADMQASDLTGRYPLIHYHRNTTGFKVAVRMGGANGAGCRVLGCMAGCGAVGSSYVAGVVSIDRCVVGCMLTVLCAGQGEQCLADPGLPNSLPMPRRPSTPCPRPADPNSLPMPEEMSKAKFCYVVSSCSVTVKDCTLALPHCSVTVRVCTCEHTAW